jgi:hypothetical protein
VDFGYRLSIALGPRKTTENFDIAADRRTFGMHADSRPAVRPSDTQTVSTVATVQLLCLWDRNDVFYKDFHHFVIWETDSLYNSENLHDNFNT